MSGARQPTIRWFSEIGSTNEALKQAVLGGESIPDGAA